jgi:hypothetical protein
MKHGTTLTIRLTYAQKRALKAIASDRQVSVSEVARAGIWKEIVFDPKGYRAYEKAQGHQETTR